LGGQTEYDEVSFRQGEHKLPGLQNKQERYKKMKLDKAAIKNEFQRHDRDTGSSEVQIAILTRQIQALTEHLKANKKDHSSRYGLLRKVANRRNLLDYLKRENEESYKQLIKKLGLRR
jgi:small subunit ribosomal protein S15